MGSAVEGERSRSTSREPSVSDKAVPVAWCCALLCVGRVPRHLPGVQCAGPAFTDVRVSLSWAPSAAGCGLW